MMGRIMLTVLATVALSSPDARGQVRRGPPQLTTCSTPFKPIGTLTFHGGYAWPVTYHTYPGQFGHAQYSGDPNPVTSTDGGATWTNPGVYVECTLTWAYNPNGSVAYVEYNWHIISYFGTIAENGDGGGCDGGGVTDPIYLTSYDPYAPVPEDEASVSCGGGGGQGGGSRTTCGWDWVRLEISYDGGTTWHLYWEGWTQVCVQEA